jgi:aminoglycoside phosphotransferase family enzyme
MFSTVGGATLGTVSLADKVSFLSRADAYEHMPPAIIARETHMSWVFLAGDRVFKLKKPVKSLFLNFSTIDRREIACRAEFSLNRRLARPVYLRVEPLTRRADGSLDIGGEGDVVDWLVVMRRLDESMMLDALVVRRAVTALDLNRLVETLAHFYAHAKRPMIGPDAYLRAWRLRLAENRSFLNEWRNGVDPEAVHRSDLALRRFLAEREDEIAARVNDRWIVDGHGDLRPEHVWFGHPMAIIDCLEFNASLRAVDPFDDVAYLSVECDRFGASEVGRQIAWGLHKRLGGSVSNDLFRFYRCYRAMLRTRQAIAHLLDENPRTPEKWQRLARCYLRLAVHDANRLLASLFRHRHRRDSDWRWNRFSENCLHLGAPPEHPAQ